MLASEVKSRGQMPLPWATNVRSSLDFHRYLKLPVVSSPDRREVIPWCQLYYTENHSYFCMKNISWHCTTLSDHTIYSQIKLVNVIIHTTHSTRVDGDLLMSHQSSQHGMKQPLVTHALANCNSLPLESGSHSHKCPALSPMFTTRQNISNWDTLRMSILMSKCLCHVNPNMNKAIVDYTSPTLCTPVTPFPANKRCCLSSKCRRRTEPQT